MRVPITTVRWVTSVTAAAARSPGSTTPITGTSTVACRYGRAAAVALLHATTIIFAPAVDEQVGDLDAEAPAARRRAVPVGVAGRVAEVEQVLVREQVGEGLEDRQAPETAVEHADGAVVHAVALGSEGAGR
jgi:hypothetical protein